MALYRYASSAQNMPLIQYLGYYQVIEHYFTIYTVKQVQEIIKNDIEDPSFKNDIDNKIKNMIFKIKSSLAGMG